MSTTTRTTGPYVFEGGFPTPETIQRPTTTTTRI
jgi:hypothetical protein